MSRARPNIAVTGTPGTGKSTFAEALATELHMHHLNLGEIIRRESLYTDRDEETGSLNIDDDALLAYLEPFSLEGGYIFDLHSCEIYPEDWIDLVIVLRANNTVLYDRLQSRGYNERKLGENMECEIMQECLEEAREAFDQNIIVELENNTSDDLASNIQRTIQWYQSWVANNSTNAEDGNIGDL